METLDEFMFMGEASLLKVGSMGRKKGPYHATQILLCIILFHI